ncbi:MAG: hypothetical protein KA407_06370 [Spirochaetes bacterium]|nr:hypothetical protein [Spirochaetota bacterium]
MAKVKNDVTYLYCKNNNLHFTLYFIAVTYTVAIEQYKDIITANSKKMIV